MDLDIRLASVGYVVVVSLSMLFLFGSGISEDHLLYPMSFSANLLDPSSLGINFMYVILFLVIFPLSASLVSVYTLRNKNPDFALLIAPLIASVLVFILDGLSISSLLISIGLISSVLVVMYVSSNDMEYYKKLSPFRIASRSSSKSFWLLTLVFVFLSYLAIPSNPAEVESIVLSDINQSISGMIPENNNAAAIESNRLMIYSYLEFSERSLLNSFRSSSSDSLTSEQAMMCYDALQSKLDEIDRETKGEVDRQFEEELDELNSRPMISDSMLDMFVGIYPYSVMLTVFFIISMICSIALVPLSGFYAYILASIFPVSLSPEQNNLIYNDAGNRFYPHPARNY